MRWDTHTVPHGQNYEGRERGVSTNIKGSVRFGGSLFLSSKRKMTNLSFFPIISRIFALHPCEETSEGCGL